MVKHIETIRRQKPTNCLSVSDHFVGLTLKGLTASKQDDLKNNLNISNLKEKPRAL